MNEHPPRYHAAVGFSGTSLESLRAPDAQLGCVERLVELLPAVVQVKYNLQVFDRVGELRSRRMRKFAGAERMLEVVAGELRVSDRELLVNVINPGARAEGDQFILGLTAVSRQADEIGGLSTQSPLGTVRSSMYCLFNADLASWEAFVWTAERAFGEFGSLRTIGFEAARLSERGFSIFALDRNLTSYTRVCRYRQQAPDSGRVDLSMLQHPDATELGSRAAHSE